MIILTTILVIESFIFTAYYMPVLKKVATQKWRHEKG
jgi:NADH:ubiquinone oxidoreductase subunit 2 (subunit N)